MKGLLGTIRPDAALTYRRGELLLVLGQVAGLAVLLAHAARYAFLTDDAFISFRYALNFSDGRGLVFNPGAPPVEGYTNFLWVLLLSLFSRLGVAPESVAHLLTIAGTVVLWWLVADYASRQAPDGRRWAMLIPTFLLASTRSVAVWSTGGLETRLFEVLVLAGTLRVVAEVRAALRRKPVRAWSGLLFALAALTRPDGILLYGGAAAAAAVTLLRRGRFDARRFLAGPAWFAGIVAAHFVFRRLYYGAWLPNTFYAKVTGLRWGLGWAHHGSFALEYFAWLWVPLLAVAVVRHVRSGTGWVPAVFGAVVVPHVVYVAAVGGDHFEYRPQDLYFPFAFLLMIEAWKAFPAGRRGAAALLATATAVLAGLTILPAETRAQFPAEYHAGFPGWATGLPEGRVYLHPDNSAVLRVPPLRSLAEAHRDLLRRTTRSFVGIRQEEHALFLAEVTPEAERLAQLVREGVVPADARFALDSVGKIPYTTGLPVLDRLGLTDAHVARFGDVSADRLVAHERRASYDYAREQGVDFWAFDSVHSLFRADDPALADLVRTAQEHSIPAFRADAGEGWVMLGLFPQGEERGRAKFPRLEFRSVLEGVTR